MDQELVQYLDERFGRIEQRLDSHDQRFDLIDRRFNLIDQKFASIDQRFESVEDRFDDLKRHTGVLVEGLRHEIQLVAEGITMHIQVQHVQERAYHDQQHRETRALMRSFYDELRQQNERLQQHDDELRQRVENLERKQN